MNTFLSYMLMTIVSLGIVYAGYVVVLRKETFFRLNRVYLLSGLIFSFLLPLAGSMGLLPDVATSAFRGEHLANTSVFGVADIPAMDATIIEPFAEDQTELSQTQVDVPFSAVQPLATNTGPLEVSPTPVEQISAMHSGNSSLTVGRLLWLIYLLVSLLLLVRFLVRLYGILKLRRHSETRTFEGYSVCVVPDEISPYSFFSTIFISRTIDNESQWNEIVRHEAVHIREKHSFDIVLIQSLKVFFWFNPFLYLVDRFLRETHEFQADARVLKEGVDVVTYQNLLLRHLGTGQAMGVSNNFNTSLIKRRLLMFTHKSSRWSGCKPVLMVPLVLSLMFFFASGSSAREFPPVAGIAENQQGALAMGTPLSVPENGPAQISVASMEQNMQRTAEFAKPPLPLGLPEFPGGEAAMDSFIRANLRYPAIGKADNRGMMKLAFTVEPDGSLSHVHVVSSVSPECDAEAIRVISSMPRWRPGMFNGKPVSVHKKISVIFYSRSDDVSKRRKRWTGTATSPEFPGGEEKLNAFLEKNLNYRYTGAANDAEYAMRVNFLVDTDGSLCEIRLASYGTKSMVAMKYEPVFAAEAIRVVSSMPKWVPAKNEAGELVCVSKTLELTFGTAGLAATPQVFSSVSQATGEDYSGEVFLDDEVDVRPTYPGGAGKLQEYVDKYLPNPGIKEHFAESGFGLESADVVYIVETDGSITNVALRKSSGNPAFDAAFVKFYSTNMPKWEPAMLRGKPVRAFMQGYSTSAATRPVLGEGIWVMNLIHPYGTTKALNRMENMPQFPGGYSALKQFFSTHLKYPVESLNKGIQGVVTLSYLVGTDGAVSEIEVIRSLDRACDAEAIRLAASLPRWKPAAYEGTRFPVRIGMAVSFILPKQWTGTPPALSGNELRITEGRYVASSHREYIEFLPDNRVSFQIHSRTGIYITYTGMGRYLLRDGYIIIQPDRPAWLPDSVVQRIPKTVSSDSVRVQVRDRQGVVQNAVVSVVSGSSRILTASLTDVRGNAVVRFPESGKSLMVNHLGHSSVSIEHESLSGSDYQALLEGDPSFRSTMDYLQSLAGGLEYKFSPGKFSIRRKIGFMSSNRGEAYDYQWVDYEVEK